jgi:predicted hydrocarbon binding protein
VLADIVTSMEPRLAESDKARLKELIDQIGAKLPLRRFNFEQFARLYSEFDVLERLSVLDPAQALLAHVATIFSLSGLSKVFSYLGHSTLDAEILRDPVQQIIVALGAFLQYDQRATLVKLEIIQNKEALEKDLQKYLETRYKFIEMLGLDPVADEDVGTKVFDLVNERGLLFNRSDKSRNVSFKVATLVNLLSHIYTGITEIKSREEADRIFERAGHVCGTKFGAQMYESSRRSRYQMTDAEIVEQWCEFDSDVGFGRFHNNLRFERSEHHFEVHGSINLSDNFLITSTIGGNTVHICPFMKGYIQGVMEMMFRANFEITHDISDCEQGGPGNQESTFNVRTLSSNEL